MSISLRLFSLDTDSYWSLEPKWQTIDNERFTGLNAISEKSHYQEELKHSKFHRERVALSLYLTQR